MICLFTRVIWWVTERESTTLNENCPPPTCSPSTALIISIERNCILWLIQLFWSTWGTRVNVPLYATHACLECLTVAVTHLETSRLGCSISHGIVFTTTSRVLRYIAVLCVTALSYIAPSLNLLFHDESNFNSMYIQSILQTANINIYCMLSVATFIRTFWLRHQPLIT